MISKSEFLAGLEDRQVVLAPVVRTMSQDVKVAVICDEGLTLMHEIGTCTKSDLEVVCQKAGLTGRIVVQLGVGLGGKLGLRLHRDKDGDVIVCQENVLILTRRLGDAGMVAWHVKTGVSEEQLRVWFDGLPAL